MYSGQEAKYREKAIAGKYRRLYMHLSGLQPTEWRTSFSEVESILGFSLPPSARIHRPWWANQRSDNGHSHALAWTAAGWETADVDMNAETLSFRRRKSPKTPLLDEIWPTHSVKTWPEGLSLRREDMYDERA